MVICAARKMLYGLSLVRQLAKREIKQTYRSSYLGVLWTILGPLFLLAVYFFVFGVVFNGSYGSARPQTQSEYALTLFCSLSVFAFFGNTVNNATALFISRQNYVTQMVFPLELLPFVLLAVEAFNLAISMGLVLVFFLFMHGLPPALGLLIPIQLIPLALCALGLSYFVASLTVFVRDVGKAMPHIMMGLSFGSAVFFPISMAPPSLRFLLYYNPVAIAVEHVRGMLLLGVWPDWKLFGFSMVCGIFLYVTGYWFFKWTRPSFADFI